MPDILTSTETATATTARRQPVRDSGTTDSGAASSPYRERLSQSLNGPGRSAEVAEQAVQRSSDSPESARSRSDGTDVPTQSAGTATRGKSKASVAPHEAKAAPVRDIDATQDGAECPLPQSCERCELEAVVTLAAVDELIIPFEPDEYIPADGEIPDGAPPDISVEMQSVAGMPPAQLQMPAVTSTRMTKPPVDSALELLVPPVNLKIAIDSAALSQANASAASGDGGTFQIQSIPPARLHDIDDDGLSLPTIELAPGTASTSATGHETTNAVDATSTVPGTPAQQSSSGSIFNSDLAATDATAIIEPAAATKPAHAGNVTHAATFNDATLQPVQQPPAGIAPPQSAITPHPQARLDTFAAISGTEKQDQVRSALVATRGTQERTSSEPSQSNDTGDNSGAPADRGPAEWRGTYRSAAAAVDAAIPPAMEVPENSAPATGSELFDDSIRQLTNDRQPGEASSALRIETSTHTSLSREPGAPVDVQAKEFVDRIANSLRFSHESGGHLRMRLNPPELGALQVEVVSRGGTLTARLDVQTAAVHRAIVDNLPMLYEALAQHGATIDRIEVHITRNWNEDAGAHSGGGQSGQSEQQPSQQQHEWQHQQEQNQGEASHSQTVASTQAHLDQLDIQI